VTVGSYVFRVDGTVEDERPDFLTMSSGIADACAEALIGGTVDRSLGGDEAYPDSDTGVETTTDSERSPQNGDVITDGLVSRYRLERSLEDSVGDFDLTASTAEFSDGIEGEQALLIADPADVPSGRTPDIGPDTSLTAMCRVNSNEASSGRTFGDDHLISFAPTQGGDVGLVLAGVHLRCKHG